MTTTNDGHDDEVRGTLPPDLRALDRELSAIRIEERPSFAPELEAELSRVWRARSASGSGRSRWWLRPLLAAGVAGLMIAGVSVPAARAAVFQLVRTVAAEAFPALFQDSPSEESVQPETQVTEPAPPEPEPRSQMVVSPVGAMEEDETPGRDQPANPILEMTLPEIVSLQEAARIIASHYPVELQEAGVEGSVKLQFWLDADGIPLNIEVREGSGDSRLDSVAIQAAREVPFRPATRNGEGVGTWVEVEFYFYALTGAGIIGPDTTGGGG